MDLQHNQTNKNADNVQQQPWYGSKSSCLSEKSTDGNFMMFQSKDPIISIPLEKVSQDKAAGGGGGGHSHGIPVEHPTSYLETLMHLFKGNVGSGIFAMGDAIRNAGIIVGPIVVLILGIICVHCQHLLFYFFDVHGLSCWGVVVFQIVMPWPGALISYQKFRSFIEDSNAASDEHTTA